MIFLHAAALRSARRAAGLSQEELAARAGLSRMTVQKLEAGTIDPRMSTLVVLMRVLGLDLLVVPAELKPTVEDFLRSGGRVVAQPAGVTAPVSIVDAITRAPDSSKAEEQAMTLSIRYLRLYLHLPNGERRAIGYLSHFGDYLRVSFDESYIEDPDRPTLSLLFRGATEADTKQILRATRDERLVRADGRWPTWFANLLPEGHNRERLARARGCSVDDEFELLAAAGHDLAGAVEVEPVPAADKIPSAVLAWHAATGIDVTEPDVVAAPIEDAASLAGFATKFSAIKDGRRYVVKRHGKPGAYILKLPSTRHPDLVENELTGYRLAGILELDCAEVARISRDEAELPEHVDFPHVLAVKRFDRADGRRIHMEEMAQAVGYAPKKKYGLGLDSDLPKILRLLDQLSANPANDVREVVERLVAFVLMGNADAHLKNWALVYVDGTTPALSPLYDPVCVTAWFDELAPHEYALNRRVDRALSELDWAHLRALIDAADVPRAARLVQVAKETVKRAKAKWPAILRDAPDNLRTSIEARLAGGVVLAR